MPAITKEQMRLMDEIKADPKAVELLRAKQRWEGMTGFGVLAEWGDPRTWESYKSKDQG